MRAIVFVGVLLGSNLATADLIEITVSGEISEVTSENINCGNTRWIRTSASASFSYNSNIQRYATFVGDEAQYRFSGGASWQGEASEFYVWEGTAGTITVRSDAIDVVTDPVSIEHLSSTGELRLSLWPAEGTNIFGNPPAMPDKIFLEMCDPDRRCTADLLWTGGGGTKWQSMLEFQIETLDERRFPAGDSNQSGAFDQLDLIQVLARGKYQTSEPALWSQGDWDGDGLFDQMDIVEVLQAGTYMANTQLATVPEPASIVLLVIGVLLSSIEPLVRRRSWKPER